MTAAIVSRSVVLPVEEVILSKRAQYGIDLPGSLHYFGGGRIPIERGQKWFCFGHFSRWGILSTWVFSKRGRNPRI